MLVSLSIISAFSCPPDLKALCPSWLIPCYASPSCLTGFWLWAFKYSFSPSVYQCFFSVGDGSVWTRHAVVVGRVRHNSMNINAALFIRWIGIPLESMGIELRITYQNYSFLSHDVGKCIRQNNSKFHCLIPKPALRQYSMSDATALQYTTRRVSSSALVEVSHWVPPVHSAGAPSSATGPGVDFTTVGR